MAQTIKLKRSALQGAIPSTSSLELGEVAINTYDGKMYIKKDDGTPAVVEIGEVTQADVTAHEAALSITKSQVTDLATSDLDLGTNKILYSNVYSTLEDLPDASSYHGMFAHVHGTGKGYYAHAGSWVELANSSELFDGAYSSLTGAPTNVSSFTNDAGYLTSETTTTLTADSVNQKLVFTDETGTPNDVDLSWAVDDLTVLSTKAIDNPNYHGTSASDEFGYAVAVSGNYTVVGAPKEDELIYGIPYDNTGRAYIFDTDSGSLLYTLQDTVNDQNANFGTSVDVSGKYAIVGAPGASGFVEGQGAVSQAGQAYIFDVTTGSLVHTLDNPNAYNTGTLDRFGHSVSISGNYAIVGTPDEDDAAGLSSGKAYIFDVETGTLLYTLNNPNPYGTSESDQFAYSVSISGNHVIVGAPGEQGVSAGTANSGSAYVYDISTFTTSTITSATYRLTNTDGFGDGTGDRYGTSVSISGNYAIVGAPDEDDANGNSSGKAYLYDISTFTTSLGGLILSSTHILDNPNVYGTSTNDQYGASVSISGNYVVVGAVGEDESSGSDSGKVYLYDISTFTTKTISSANYVLDNPNAYSTPTTDNFGSSVAISGNRVVVGTYNEDDANGTTSGKTYIFRTNTQPYSYTGDEIASFAGYTLPTASDTVLGGVKVGTGLAIDGNGVLSATQGGTADSVEWTGVLNTPTTIAGYGITDAFDGAFSSLSGTPTTLAGYGITDAFDGAYSSLTGAPTTVSSFTNDAGYLTSETTTTLTGDSVNQKLVFTDETGTPNDIDLSWTVDDTNLARITSGSVNGSTGIATFTRDDATTFTVDFSALFDDTNLTRITSGSVSGSTLTLTRSDATTVSVDVSSLLDNTDTIDYINAASFNAGTGVLSLTGVGNAGATVDLDGRYLTSVAFSDLTSTPTTLAGYGITDAFDGDYSSLSNSPTSILNFGITDGTAGQVLQTDGSGNFSFTTVSSGGISNLVEDTTPQLGGTLDANNNNITNIGADGYSLPTADGTSGQVLTTDGAGTLSFTTPASGGTDVYLVDGGSATAIYTNGDLILDGGNA